MDWLLKMQQNWQVKEINEAGGINGMQLNLNLKMMSMMQRNR